MAQSCDEHSVGVPGVNNDRADVLSVAQSNVLPGLSAIKRFEHSVAIGHIAADAGFAGPGVNDVVVGIGNGNRADRRGRFMVEKRFPVHPAIGRFPYPACYRAEEICVRFTRNTGYGQSASTTERADVAPVHATKKLLIVSLSTQGDSCERKKQNQAHSSHAEVSRREVKNERLSYTAHWETSMAVRRGSSPEGMAGIEPGCKRRRHGKLQQSRDQYH